MSTKDVTAKNVLRELSKEAGLQHHSGLTTLELLGRLRTWIRGQRRERFVGTEADVTFTCTCADDPDSPCPTHGMNRPGSRARVSNPVRIFYGLPGSGTLWRFTQQGENTTGRLERSDDRGGTWENSEMDPELLVECGTLGEAKRVSRRSPRAAGSGVRR